MRGCGKRSEEHTSELQSHLNLVCRLLLEKKELETRKCSSTMYRLSAGFCIAQIVPRSRRSWRRSLNIFFFNDTATTEIYTLSLHDALPICRCTSSCPSSSACSSWLSKTSWRW